jgi:hypothetical protein
VITGGRVARQRTVQFGRHSGTICLDRTLIRFADIAPIIDTTPSVNYTFNVFTAGEQVNVIDGPVVSGVQTTQINSGTSGAFELADIANKTHVTINANAGAQAIAVDNPTPAAGLADLTIGHASAGESTVSVAATSVPLALVGGGNDAVTIGAGSTAGLLAPVTVSNPPPALTALTIDDSAATAASHATVSTDAGAAHVTIAGLAPASITATTNGISSLTLDGGSGGNTFTLSGSGFAGPLAVNSGTGADTVNIHATSANSPVTVHGQDGVDTVNVGDASGVQHIAAPVSVDNAANYSHLVIDDSADTTARTATLAAGKLATVSGLAPSTISGRVGDLSSMTVDGGTGANAFTITGTASGASTTLNTGGGPDTVSVHGTGPGGQLNVNGGADTVGIGNGGVTQGILGPVSVTDAARLTLDDSADTTARIANVDAGMASGLTPATAPIDYADVPALTLDAGSGSDAFTVTPSPATEYTLDGGAPDPPALPGDALSLTLGGAAGAALTANSAPQGFQGSWSFANRRSVSFTRFESFNPTVVSIANATAAEPARGFAPMTFTASLLAPASEPVSVDYGTANGSATTAERDYQATNGRLTFAPGVVTQQIAVPIGADAPSPTRTEQFLVNLAGAENAIIGTAQATGTITDRDTLRGLRLAGQNVLVTKGVAPITGACPAGTLGGCSGVLTIASPPIRGRHGLTLGSAHFSLTPGAHGTIRVHLSRAAQRLLKASRSLKSVATATARDQRGMKIKSTAHVTLHT